MRVRVPPGARDDQPARQLCRRPARLPAFAPMTERTWRRVRRVAAATGLVLTTALTHQRGWIFVDVIVAVGVLIVLFQSVIEGGETRQPARAGVVAALAGVPLGVVVTLPLLRAFVYALRHY